MARRKTPGSLVLAVIVIIVLGCAVGFFFHNQNINSPVVIAADITVTVENGSGSATISRQLYEAGLTRGANTFRLHSRQANIDGQLRAGAYIFTAGEWSLENIGLMLIEGGNLNSADISVTIPEGLTVSQIAQIFASRDLVDYDEFIDIANNAVFSFNFIPETIIAPASRLEGYLAPDTYMISPEWSAYQIIEMLLRQSERIWTDDFQAQADYLGMSRNEILSLAAIIEKEAVRSEERPLISGVFHNRLRIGQRLESCATVQFLLPEPQVPLLYASLRIESPFNTYQNFGLPPAPIAAPGRASIEAALWPEDSNYFFFRARRDGSHRFSETFSQHMRRHEDDQ